MSQITPDPPGPPPGASPVRIGAGILVLGVAIAAAVALTWVGPASWYGPLGVMAIAALLIWWAWARADRTRARDLGEVAEQLRRVGLDESAPSGLGGILTALARAGDRAAAQSSAHASAAARWQALLDAVPLPVLTTDEGGAVTTANRAAAEFLGRPAHALAGRPLEDLVAQSEVLALHQRARRGETARARVRVLDTAPPRSFDAAAEPLTTPDGHAGVVLTLLDVTELATAVQLKSDFAANASHELRTPIAAIKGAVDTMGPAADDPAMTARLRQIIAQHVVRLQDLVDDLLDLSRLESAEGRPDTEPLALPDLAASLTEFFDQRHAERGTRLEFDLDPALDRMRTDPRLLELILRNLIDNALKFARDGTAVRIVARATEVEPAPDAPGAADEPAGLTGARFRVIDQGIGIPLAHQQRIFERFYQVDPSRDGHLRRRGTGLGLAIVKHALRRLGGRISVESVWQQGTTMTFEIPHCVETAPGRV